MNHFPRFFLVSIIKVYQKTLSMDHGPLRHLHPEGYCRFKPSCSQYGIEAVEQFGVIKGGGKTLWRVARCNPWNDGGYDSPVQKKADDQN
ncbi:membrane protein insertion efficiency factor YidD [Candidatus Uhrbacteria bacterium]|nr:membrane protein insertion efficiency factor YidD [Candidatus Uhrbacteria bacterium]